MMLRLEQPFIRDIAIPDYSYPASQSQIGAVYCCEAVLYKARRSDKAGIALGLYWPPTYLISTYILYVVAIVIDYIGMHSTKS